VYGKREARYRLAIACYVCSLRAFRLALISGLILACAGVLPGQSLYVKPVKVLGDPNFIGTAASPLAFDSIGPNVVEGRELYAPLGIALDTSVSPAIVYIADTNNNRVLGYRYSTQLNAGAFADVILGQPDGFSTTAKGPGTTLSTGLRSPTGMVVDGNGNLYVADTGNNRIVRYPTPMAQPAGYQFPDLIIGQTAFSGSGANTGGISAKNLFLTGGGFFAHTGLALDAAGNLWVTDTGNNRVLRYPAGSLKANQNGPAADTAVGQADLVSSAAVFTRTTKTGLNSPTSVAFDATGRMLVADALARVVVYAASPTTGVAAIRLLGVAVPSQAQPNPPAVSGYNIGSATAVAANGTDVFVVDSVNNRVLIYGTVDTWTAETSTLISPFALNQLGQNTLTDSKANQGGEPSANTLSGPIDVAFGGGELFVTDASNNRVLVYPSTPSGSGPVASRVIGQLDFPDAAPNLAEGKEFFTSGSVNNGLSGTAVLDQLSTPPHLYIADTGNNRILGFNDFQHWKPGQKADLVIGQPDFSRTTINYPSNQASMPNAQGLYGPSALAIDPAGNLYVADTFNSRVLRFPAPFASGTTTLESADLVIGQADFNTIVTDPTARTLNTPTSVSLSQAGADLTQPNSGYLLVTDANENRVLLFPKPFSSGMSATKVIGQPFFTSNASAKDTTHLTVPRAAVVDPVDRILVADTGNGRIQVYDTVQNLPVSGASAAFSISNGLSAPLSIGMAASGQFWVADVASNNMVHFASIDQLPLSNYTSDTSLPVLSPRSAFVDSFSNLLVADGLNRVLYFAPGIAAVNAANFLSGRPLTPGAFAAVFPAVKTNTLSTGTGTATSFPLPTTLADTQVVVNNVAMPLLFVSQGQINLPLSMSLPTGGTVDMQVVRVSTGQIYGTTEIPMSTASPALFTISGSGSGLVAAINVADGTVNSAKTPVVRGQYVTIFGTGQGFVANAPPDGQAATGPVPTAAHPEILLGGAFVPDADIQYSGLAPSLAGVWQINFQVPTTVAPGNAVPLKVLMNSIPSDNPSAPSQIAVTLAVK
jgi:uncharacterized protein (TIGR03437 family)